MEAYSYEAALYPLVRIQVEVKCFANENGGRQSSAISPDKTGQL
jgi:hypothetical protein